MTKFFFTNAEIFGLGNFNSNRGVINRFWKYLCHFQNKQFCEHKKKSACSLLKNNGTSLARTVTNMFSSKTINDLTKSIIHSHWRLIYVRRFTSVYEVNGEESYCISRFNFFLQGLWQYGACVLLVRVLSSQQIPVRLHQLWNIE